MSLKPIPEGPLRNGYTTGACATACTKAGLISLITQKETKEVEISLPTGIKVEFTINACSFTHNLAVCSTIKDAGDDPDVTHGAEIGCKVSFNSEGKIVFLQGEGVGKVTLSGLSVPIGEPAINPVPRQMMTAAVMEVLAAYNLDKGVNLEVFVVNGKEIAKRTLNARLGIIGGISILGTTGIVRPFSASAYIASIVQGIDVALANGAGEIVINSGGRTEKMLQRAFPQLPAYCFIQYGNWIGETLEKIKHSSLKKVTMGIMLGKACKLAQGELDTHSQNSTWDKNFISKLAQECGYDESISHQILSLNMARNLSTIFEFEQDQPFYQKLCEYCFNTCKKYVNDLSFEIILINTDERMVRY